jgi:hypothetical protein
MFMVSQARAFPPAKTGKPPQNYCGGLTGMLMHLFIFRVPRQAPGKIVQRSPDYKLSSMPENYYI